MIFTPHRFALTCVNHDSGVYGYAQPYRSDRMRAEIAAVITLRDFMSVKIDARGTGLVYRLEICDPKTRTRVL